LLLLIWAFIFKFARVRENKKDLVTSPNKINNEKNTYSEDGEGGMERWPDSEGEGSS
jgi:hypothetical protein